MRRAVVLLVMLTGCVSSDPTPFANPEPLGPSERVEVVYFVEGTATSASLTISNAQGNTEQSAARTVPLQTDAGLGYSIGRVAPGSFLYISAQNDGQTGTIRCRIEVDGVEVSRASSNGAYTIATCDAVA